VVGDPGVEGAVVGRNCDIRAHAHVHEGAAIGDEVTLGAQSAVLPGVRIYPYKEVETASQIHESLIWESRGSSHVFGKDGVSGLVNVDLTPDKAVQLAAALGTALKRGSRVVASREAPAACRMIKRAMISGLNSTGVHVADLRILPSAVSRHLLKTHGYDAGFHVSVSHSDPELLQIRFYEQPGIQLTSGLQKEVEKHFARHELRRAAFNAVGEVSYPARVRESYAQDLLAALDVDAVRAREFRIVVDYGYSATSFVLPLVLGPLGVEAVSAHLFSAEGTQASATLLESVGQAKRLVHGKPSEIKHDGRGLFEGLPEPFEAGRYHSLAVTSVPDCLEVSATCADDEVMAVRHRELPVDGVQFHPESVLTPVGPQLAKNFLEGAR